jgi:hypothetical protein
MTAFFSMTAFKPRHYRVGQGGHSGQGCAHTCTDNFIFLFVTKEYFLPHKSLEITMTTMTTVTRVVIPVL